MSSNGLLYDELMLDGNIEKGSKRCWPMTELIKASIAQAKAGHTQNEKIVKSEKVAVKALQDLKRTYLSVSTNGAYIDQLDAENNVVADVAPASTLYHLIVAAAEVCAYIEK
jgi:mannose-6-phosphate isomerase